MAAAQGAACIHHWDSWQHTSLALTSLLCRSQRQACGYLPPNRFACELERVSAGIRSAGSLSEHPAGLGAGALAAAQQDAVRREATHQKALDDMQVRHLPRHRPTLQRCRSAAGMTAAVSLAGRAWSAYADDRH